MTVQPLKTKAVAVVDDVVLLIGSALLAAVGVTVTSNYADVIGDFLNSCSDTLREWIYDIGDTWVGGAKKILEVAPDVWDSLQIDAHKHFNKLLESPVGITSVEKNASGIYGFTNSADTQIKIHVGRLNVCQSVRVDVTDDFSVTFYNNYVCPNGEYFTGCKFYFASNDLSFFKGDFHSSKYNYYDIVDLTCSFGYSSPFYEFKADYQYIISDGSYSNYGFIYNLSSTLFSSLSSSSRLIVQTSDGYAVQNSNGNYLSLKCDNVERTFFPNQVSILEFLFQSVGLAHMNTTKLFDTVAVGDVIVGGSDVASDVVIDKDYFPTDADIEAETKEAVSIVVPSDIADVSTETVLDTSAEDIYDGDLPLVTAPSNLFTDKFPFCLPWDLYNLIASLFSSESSPPSFTLPLPAGYSIVIDFGGSDELVTSDETAVTISLSKFDFIVKMLRFFVGGLWVLGLILISRKLIGGE